MRPSSVAGQVLHTRRRGVIGWALGATALPAITASFWPIVEQDQEQLERLMEGLPEAMLAAFGMMREDLFSPGGFLDTQLFAFYSPILLLIFAIGGAASTLAGEEEDGRLEMLLANPVSRARVVVSKAGGLGLLLLGITAVHFVALVVAVRIVDLGIGVGHLAAMHLSLFLLAAAFGALSLAVAGAMGRRGAALGVSAAVAFATYLLDSFSGMVDWLEPVRPLSPFYLYRGAEPLTHGLDPLHAGALAGIVVVLLAVTVWRFDRRDIGT